MHLSQRQYLSTIDVKSRLEVFYLNSTINFGIPPVFVFHLEVYYKVDRLLTGLTAQQKGTTAQWYSNKTSLPGIPVSISENSEQVTFIYIIFSTFL